MKVVQLLTLVKTNYPTAITDGTLIHYINMLEDMVYSEVIGVLDTDPLVIDSEPPTEREQYRPLKKTFEDIHEQELSLTALGDRWAELYEFYLYSRMALLNKDFEDYQNYAAMYNAIFNEFFRFYNSRRKSDKVWR